ncbi:MAG: hypothetical protein ACLQGP_29620 [Isosphaeraceae bacterium]
MNSLTFAIVIAAIGAEPPQVEAGHAKNPVYAGVLESGLKADGEVVKLPAPRLHDGEAADAQRAALREVAGSDRALAELVRNSVTAPYIIKVRDVKSGGATIRVADIWFVVHADIAQVDPAKEAARSDGQSVEAGNMAVQTRLLKADDLRAAGIAPAPESPAPSTWYTHIHGRLLGRIELEVTNQIVASQTAESIVIASRTDPAFDKAGPNANGWRPIGGETAEGALRSYQGGISYSKISRLAFQPGALLVEIHSAFIEPHEWFQGAPILRSKFSVIAQDQIRSLRRELVRQRKL